MSLFPPCRGPWGARYPSSDTPPRICGVCSLQPPWGGPGSRQDGGSIPTPPARAGTEAPASPTHSFCSLFSSPRGCGRGGGLLVLLPFFISVNDSEEVSRCRRGVFISARSGKRQVHPPEKQYFLITCQKSAAKEPCAPRPQSPAGTTGLFLYSNSSRGPAQPRQGFLLLSAILKTRNKRIFNEPPRGRACALFGVQGWSSPSRAPDPQGLCLPPDPEGEREGVW